MYVGAQGGVSCGEGLRNVQSITAILKPESRHQINPGNKTFTRNWGIDCLRGISILFVVLNHLGLGFRLPLSKSALIEIFPKRFLSAISFNGYEAVFIFFVISGFLIASRVLNQYGTLQNIDWRDFYRRRASRILPLLLVLLAVLSLLHVVGFKDYVIAKAGQSLGGASTAALGLYLNWYEGQTTWLPASWDILWSLSIEEVFYIGFPLVCLFVPRVTLIVLLVLLALSLPFTKMLLDGNEIWQEKAYLPGMSAIATGVLCAVAAQYWPTPRRAMVWAMLAVGSAGLFMVFFFGPLVWKALRHGNMLVLTSAAAFTILACHNLCKQQHAPHGLGWLAAMGRLSYEIYLSHMFTVLTMVALYRAYAPDLRWGFLVYLPCIALCVFQGAILERTITVPCEKYLRRGMQ